MDVVDDGFQAVWKPRGMRTECSVGRAAIEGTVVDVDIIVAGMPQSQPHKRIGLLADKGVMNEVTVGVPRTPPHRGRIVGSCLGQRKEQKQND